MRSPANTKSLTSKVKSGRSRPGTAVQTKGQHRVEEILAAARAILVEEGNASLTTRKVAERVGIRQSNVQYYFPSKSDLVRALFEQSIALNMSALARRMETTKMSPVRRMIWTIDHFLGVHQHIEEQAFLRELWALAAHDPDFAEVMNRFYEGWVDMVTSNILEVNPKMDRRKAQRRALLIISLVDGLSLFHGAAGIKHAAINGIEKELRETVLSLVNGD